jgi:monoterpene epsilon-lactone hydrolase
MGQTLSLVWESFSFPYKVAIVASFLMWLKFQRRRFLGLIFIIAHNLVRISIKRMMGQKVHRAFLTDFATPIVRDMITSLEFDFLNGLFTAQSRVTPKKYPVFPINDPNFKAFWYGSASPDSKETVVILYVHGGAYVINNALGATQMFDFIISKLKEQGIECAVISVEYTLAPLGAFPRPVHEVVNAYQFLLKKLGIGPNRIIVAGDSSGGALALALNYQVKDSTPPAGLVLISPWVDSRPSDKLESSPNLEYDFLTPKFLNQSINIYLQGQSQNQLTSPILGNTQGLPLTLVVYGGKEIFKDDIEAFMKKFKTENGEDRLQIEYDEEGVHDYLCYPDLFPDGIKSINRVVEFVREALGAQFADSC